MSTLYDVCGNHMVLKLNDEASALHYSKMIGQQEVERKKLGYSVHMAPRRTKGGVKFGISGGISRHRETRLDPAVLPSEIQALEDLTAYIKLASTSWFFHDFRPSVAQDAIRFFDSQRKEIELL